MTKNKIKSLKFTKNSEIIFEKLDKVKEIYNISTYPRVIEYLCDIAIANNVSNNSNFISNGK